MKKDPVAGALRLTCLHSLVLEKGSVRQGRQCVDVPPHMFQGKKLLPSLVYWGVHVCTCMSACVIGAEIHQHSKAVFPLFSDVSPPYTCDEMCGVHLVFRTRTLLGGEMGSLDP